MSSNTILLELFREINFDNTAYLYPTLDNLTKKACAYLKAERASVWTYSEDASMIVCQSLGISKCEIEKNAELNMQFGPGLSVKYVDHPEYFKEMENQRSIKVNDIYKSSIVKTLIDPYLKPLNICAIYDAPIWQINKVIGVLSFEYKMPKDKWDAEEELLINGIADLVAKIFEHYKVLELVEQLEVQNKNLEVTLFERTKVLHEAHKLLFRQEKLASLGKLSAAISHELKNPLHLILNASTVLKEINSNSKDIQKLEEHSSDGYLQIISDNCARAIKIIESILAQARGEKDQLAPINEVIEDSVRLIWSTMQDSNLDMAYPMCNLDQNIFKKVPKLEFQRVLVNILENSVRSLRKKVKYTQGANFTPAIELTLKESIGDYLSLTIRDNGIGISQENLLRVFDPFFTTDDKVGVGLGLFIVNELVTSMDGQIAIDSLENEHCSLNILLPI